MNKKYLAHILFYVFYLGANIKSFVDGTTNRSFSEVFFGSLLVAIIASFVYNQQLKKRGAYESWFIALFWPLYAVYICFKGFKSFGGGNNGDEAKKGSKGYFGTYGKRIVCKNCGVRMMKHFGLWSDSTTCSQKGIKCVPYEVPDI